MEMKIFTDDAFYVQRGDIIYFKNRSFTRGVFMKIITNDAAYVQKNDIAYLNQTDLDIPASIYLKTCETGTFIVDDSNRYEFIQFNEPAEIQFFKNQDWILDYNQVKDMTEDELIEYGEKIITQYNELAETFNALSEQERIQNTELDMRCDLLGFKIFSLHDFIFYRKGLLEIQLPSELPKESPFIISSRTFINPDQELPLPKKTRVLRLEKAIHPKQ